MASFQGCGNPFDQPSRDNPSSTLHPYDVDARVKSFRLDPYISVFTDRTIERNSNMCPFAYKMYKYNLSSVRPILSPQLHDAYKCFLQTIQLNGVCPFAQVYKYNLSSFRVNRMMYGQTTIERVP